MSNFYLDVIRNDPRFNSPIECRDVDLLEPATHAAVAGIIRDAFDVGVDLFVTETYRSAARQQLLFAEHATQLRRVGVHHFGLACDFAKLIDGKASWAGDWAFLGRLAAKYGMIGGIDWGKPGVVHDWVDPDHVQRCTVEQQAALFAGKWYPETA